MLAEADSQGHKVDTVVLVGGSSRVPLVARMLQEKLPFKPQNWQHQDVAVALGAAYHAQGIWGSVPFRFRSGSVAHDLEDLVGLCARHWEDALWHLMNGHFEPWLRACSHEELAERSLCVRRSGTGDTERLIAFLRECCPNGAELADRKEREHRRNLYRIELERVLKTPGGAGEALQ